MEINLENLYVDTGASRVKEVWTSDDNHHKIP